MNFAEFNIRGRRMRIEVYPGVLVVKLRHTFLWIFSRWEVTARATTTMGIRATYTMFFGEAKMNAKPLLKLAGVK